MLAGETEDGAATADVLVPAGVPAAVQHEAVAVAAEVTVAAEVPVAAEVEVENPPKRRRIRGKQARPGADL